MTEGILDTVAVMIAGAGVAAFTYCMIVGVAEWRRRRQERSEGAGR